ncbi:iron ABC transporter permease [Halorubrum sp. Atlit-8R]|uniref:FecCD family ABC transporter permease n=1 Tax=unclassified Halorubrum TaxID=2642239 RepID=UPI000EF19220|nr:MULTISPECIES: iron ABC transporter permease [unclassified Halorubrum]RLM71328.1 iron ABC transporter permease [Halorubrum sp. Atlit-9R]RLM72196.1 iron ABC transporter permease [Halorubrum sp. Atlit-9R]RLM82519.1 iron ABC transporter permease [Halorubrum sp. Atlit-8R]
MATGTSAEAAGWREQWFGWFDGSLFTLCAASLAVVVLGGLAQVSFGAFSMTIVDAWQAVFDPRVVFDAQAWRAFLLGAELPEMGKQSLIVWNIRLPRVFVAMLVGMNLAVSGAIFQAVTRNELASPFILGVSSGAGLMILLVLVAFAGATLAIPFLAVSADLSLSLTTVELGISSLLPVLAALGGAVAFLIVYAIAWKNGTSPVRLVLAGVIVGTVFSSLQTALFFFANDIGVVQSAIAWTTGSLTGTDWEQVRMALPWTVAAMLLALVSSRQLNVLLLGERTASSLGMSVEKVRFALSGVAVLAAAASIAVAGIVGFVGLIVPHMVRNIVGSDYRKLVIGCLFAGPALLVAADVGARLGMAVIVGSDAQIPVGIVTGLVGGPYFLYLMRRQEQMGEI